MTITAKVIADSISTDGIRLTTMELSYPLIVHAEFMTHRMFCLDGDSLLEFDLPKGQGEYKRVFTMTLREFAYKWFNGDSKGRSLRHRLSNMRIRQLNESTQKIETCTVRDCFISGGKEVFEITAGGMSVAGSKDHRILTVDGWKRIEELEVDKDYIITRAFGKLDEDVNYPIRLNKFGYKCKSTWLNQIRQDKLIDQNFSCYDCGTELLIAAHDLHHVIPVYMDESKTFDYNNIVALCKDCHQERHRIQWWKGGTYLYGKPELLQSIKSLGHKETFDLEMDSEYENFIANGIVVHNSRNAASNRAIPTRKIIEQVEKNPFVPNYWGKDKPGMQADEELDSQNIRNAIITWNGACESAVFWAEAFAEDGVHKQIANRVLMPYQYIKVIVTATEWDNFFNLRLHKDAQPEMQELARCMKQAMDESTPVELEPRGWWHLPYVEFPGPRGKEISLDKAVKCSVARCARVSYLNHDNTNPSIEDDIKLYDKLLEAGHMSPFEHQATPMDFAKDTYELTWEKGVTHRDRKDNLWSANFRGWIMYRKLLDV